MDSSYSERDETHLNENKRLISTYYSYCRLAAQRRGWELAPHHKLIADAIDDLIARRGPKRLLIIAPPGSAKSTYGSQMTPGYFFYREPNSSMIGGSHTQDLANDISLMAMNFIEENSAELGYKLGRKYCRQSARGWGTVAGGKYRAIGVGKRIAGERADLIFLDDPIGHTSEIDSLEKRDKLWRWFWADLRTRLRPHGRIAVITTRWHEDDIAGRLLKHAKSDEWRLLHIKAEAGEDDLLGRAQGSMLWEGEYGYANELQAIKKEYEANGRLTEWEALYQGNPTPRGGAIFQIAKISTEDVIPAGYRWIRAWDLAATSDRGDWTVGLKLGINPEGRVCVGDIVRFRGGPSDVEQIMLATAQKDGIYVTVSIPQDPGQAGVAQISYLARVLRGFVVTSSRETGDKVVRAMPIAAQINAGNVSMVYAEKWNAPFLDELAAFPKGTYDDQVDALSRAASDLFLMQGPPKSVNLRHMER